MLTTNEQIRRWQKFKPNKFKLSYQIKNINSQQPLTWPLKRRCLSFPLTLDIEQTQNTAQYTRGNKKTSQRSAALDSPRMASFQRKTAGGNKEAHKSERGRGAVKTTDGADTKVAQNSHSFFDVRA